MKTARLLWLVLLIALASSVFSCSQPRPQDGAKPATETTATVSGTLGGWRVLLSVGAELPAGASTTARIDAVNSSDTTISTRPLAKIEIRDHSGKRVPTGDWQRVVFVSQDMAPGSKFVYHPAFTVPAAGTYTMTLPGMVDSKGLSATVAFTATK